MSISYRVAPIILLALAGPASGQSTRVSPSPARLDTLVVSRSDTTQTYARFLPPGYDAHRRWPVLFVFDPRGRAMRALALVRPAAARLGYIVLSSYNSLSDGPPEPNVKAINAMIADAQGELSIDPRRFYLAGFSGTARAAIGFAVQLKGHIAGVFGDGAALGFTPNGLEVTFARDSTFAYFAAAGTRDFNYEEVRSLADRLRVSHVPVRFVSFDGPHSWPPASVCEDALDWFEFRAMRGGLRSPDSAWIADRADAELALAANSWRSGQWDAAEELYGAIAREYPPSHVVDSARAAFAAIDADPSFANFRRAEGRVMDRDEHEAHELSAALASLRGMQTLPDADAIRRAVGLPALDELAEHGDSLDRALAQRLEERVFVFLSFYEPRTYVQDGHPDRALAMLSAAATVHALQGESCDLLAHARASIRSVPAALRNECGDHNPP